MWQNMYGPANSISWIWMGLGMAVHLLFWLGVIYAVYKVSKMISQGGGKKEFPRNNNSNISAVEIVRQRYAKGAISKEQYKEMLKELYE